ncbi:MAG: aminomethyl-transferring glycine dehydrogenase [Bdellovibrionaceae bacterium]|nr:aminomethyl-transferring glycine dehydrogenase [Bdellovibrionales bacterium]MCB9086590.1 aminomethyl-transferring glycine dehydrogenase [Pseudobdellovibrionaceae bacterium]
MAGSQSPSAWDTRFSRRHLGPDSAQQETMLKTLGLKTIDDLMNGTMPGSIRHKGALDLPSGLSEAEFLKKARQVGDKNKLYRSFIGQGYYDCQVPAVILRNILENPAWYTAYTPYQAEISQGRMEALLNFQTMIADLTGLPVANASLLDEGTAAAEAMTMCKSVNRQLKSDVFVVDQNIFPQTLEVLNTRAEPLRIKVLVTDLKSYDFADHPFAVYVQYPGATGNICDLQPLADRAHDAKALFIAGADLLALTLLKPPGEMDADVVVGSSQRFGVPMGFGGPHAGFMSVKQEYIRSLPGRIIGVSKDANGSPALRLTLQTREQHIRREKATSNICTAQVLLAVMASMYAAYHGPKGLRDIAQGVHRLAKTLAAGIEQLGYKLLSQSFFDTLAVEVGKDKKASLLEAARQMEMNFADLGEGLIGLSLDETKTLADVDDVLSVFAGKAVHLAGDLITKTNVDFSGLDRQSTYLTHPTFNRYHSETEMLRYIRRLENKDLTLANAMIPLGSCTMKLNAVTEMIPVTWPEFSGLHPFVPIDQAQGYMEMIGELESWMCRLTGFAGVSFQPNAGSQGEYAGLLVIRKYHQSRGEGHRNICLIPRSAHGTNPASAVMAGMQVVVVGCDENGNIDLPDLKAKAEQHKNDLAALMVTYPSTHGVFEEGIIDICRTIHDNGGQVYMDGANFNAMVSMSLLTEIGADVCHLNLHKTFCIPHGGGGPGVGPIGVAQHLKEFLPQHNQQPSCGPTTGIGAVSAAPWGSAAILPISWAYVLMMGREGLEQATEVAILNANYIAKKLEAHYPVVYRGKNGWVAHECILDCQSFKSTSGIVVDDIAKRLMDYGFHAPTMSWPVPGTLMVEPTESESLAELDRFCEAMMQIREEIRQIEEGKGDREDNPLKNAPHSIDHLTADKWDHPYTRQEAVYPLEWVREHKFWTPVSRVDNAFGDRNLVCSCPSVGSYS